MDLEWKDPRENDDTQGEEWVKGLRGRETTTGPAWGRKSPAVAEPEGKSRCRDAMREGRRCGYKGQAGQGLGEHLGGSGLYGLCKASLQRATSSGVP